MFLAVICACVFPPVRRKHNYVMGNMLNETTRLLENDKNVVMDSCEKDIKGLTGKQSLYKVITTCLIYIINYKY